MAKIVWSKRPLLKPHVCPKGPPSPPWTSLIVQVAPTETVRAREPSVPLCLILVWLVMFAAVSLGPSPMLGIPGVLGK